MGPPGILTEGVYFYNCNEVNGVSSDNRLLWNGYYNEQLIEI
jgi:hypothetical protein